MTTKEEANGTDDRAPHSELKNIIEAALFTADEPLGLKKLRRLFPDNAQPETDDLKQVIDEIQADYATRGVELKQTGKGWRFRSQEKYAPWLRRLSLANPPRFSKALLETLAIIAYRQPVTRGDIEDVRGVSVSSDIIRALEDRGWVAEIGFRDVPGRPMLFGTTDTFLEYFGLTSLRELPELMQPRSLSVIAKDFNLELPLETVTPSVDDKDDVASETATEGAEVIPIRPSNGDNEEPKT